MIPKLERTLVTKSEEQGPNTKPHTQSELGIALILAHQIGISVVFIHVRSHILVPARGKDKKQTTARRPHAKRTSIHDVIVMLKIRHHVASQRIQDFLEIFFMFFFI